MEYLVRIVTEINEKVNGFVWGPVMIAVFLLVGIYFTVRTGFFQISRFGLWQRKTVISLFTKKNVRKTKDKKAISQFQALSTALAGTMGTGNIVGVATAIVAGGPGAIFWMWVSALFGMMTKYAEVTLGLKYRYKNQKGEWIGGPMVYIEKGLDSKWLACVFSFFCILASFGIGNMSQSNSIAMSLKDTCNISPIITGTVTAAMTGFVIFGGIKRIASVTEKVIPFVALLYIFGGLTVIAVNYKNIGNAFGMIFTDAFSFKAAGGGAVGFGISKAVKFGISRGVFTNEAGLGSSVIAHSASDVKEPVIQGMWGIFEVFADTIICCTITAITILASGVWKPGGTLDGAALSSAAFASVFGRFGNVFVSFAITLFAFATLLGWSYYGERGTEYLAGAKCVPIYKTAFILVIVVGCVSELRLVWSISDTFNGLMAIPNLLAIMLLSNEVVKMTKNYLNRNKFKKH